MKQYRKQVYKNKVCFSLSDFSLLNFQDETWLRSGFYPRSKPGFSDRPAPTSRLRADFQETVSGASAERPVLNSLLAQARAGDVLVIWKLDRLGRSLRHLVDLVGTLIAKGVDLQSLQDPIDTTHSQGRFVFNLFATLAEFERDLIRERTQAGLNAARARGRRGGRPKGLSKTAEKKAVAAEALYGTGDLSVNEVAENLGVSKATLYKYLRHRGVVVGSFRKSTPRPQPKTLKVRMHLVVENNSPFVRGKTRVLMEIEQRVLALYGMRKPDRKDVSTN